MVALVMRVIQFLSWCLAYESSCSFKPVFLLQSILSTFIFLLLNSTNSSSTWVSFYSLSISLRFIFQKIWEISLNKPSSINQSISSITKYFIKDRYFRYGVLKLVIRSRSLPGVAMIMLGDFFSYLSCFSTHRPPIIYKGLS